MASQPSSSAPQQLAPRARTATTLSAIGAAMALIALVYSAWQLNRTQAAIGTAKTELQALERRKAETLRALERLQAASQTQQAVLNELTQHASHDASVPTELVQHAKQAIIGGQRANAEAAAVVPVLGIVTAGEWQQPEAQRLAEFLRTKGYRIQIVRPVHENAAVPETSEVRYYRPRSDPGDATQLRDILRTEFGLRNAKYLQAGDTDSPPNKYEIWLDSSAFVKSTHTDR